MSDTLNKLDEWERIYRNMGDFQRANDYKQVAQEIRRLEQELEEAQRHAKGMAKVADNHKRAEQLFQATLKMIARQKLEDTELAANSQEIRSELFIWCVRLARKSLQPQQPSDVIEGKKNGEHP